MLKKLFSASVSAFLLLLLSAPLLAQDPERLELKVNRRVSLGGQSLTPGTYEVIKLNQQGLFTVRESSKPGPATFVLSIPGSEGVRDASERPYVELGRDAAGEAAITGLYFPGTARLYRFPVDARAGRAKAELRAANGTGR